MREEFAVYGPPEWFKVVVGRLKLLCATALITGIWLPAFVKPAAIGLAILMSGAVAMHLKVRDPIKKYIPSGTLLILSIITSVI